MPENTTHHAFGDQPDSLTDMSRGFRNLAKKFHPDKNPFDIEKFKEITQIYKILCTPELRSLYYKYGNKAIIMKTLIFSEDCHKPSKCQDLFYDLEVSDDDLHNGCVKIITSIKQQPFYVPMSNEYYGRSKSYFSAEGFPKPALDFVGVITLMKKLEVHISKGMDYGQKITLKEEGEEMPRHEPGDLIVVLVKKQDKVNGHQTPSEIDQTDDHKFVEPTELSP